MLHYADNGKAELVIVSRDSDYGVSYEGKNYVNDELRQEFSDRVSKKRKLLLYEKLSDALQHFERPVTQQEQEAESEILAAAFEHQAMTKEQAGVVAASDLAELSESVHAVLQRLVKAKKINP